MLDPTILAFAFCESYLNRRIHAEWRGIINPNEIEQVPLQAEGTIDEGIKQKVTAIIDSISSINQAHSTNEKIALILEFANREENEKKAAAEKARGYFYFAKMFVNSDPLLAQLFRALRSLYIAGIKDDQGFKDHYQKILRLHSEIKYPTEAEKQALETRDNALYREREKNSLQRELEILNPDNTCHEEFYKKWVRTDSKANELNEETLEQCQENVVKNLRPLDLCKRICPTILKTKPVLEEIKPATLKKPDPVIVVVKKPEPIVVIAKPEVVVEKPQVIPVKEPETQAKAIPKATYANRVGAKASTLFKQPEQPVMSRRTRRQVKRDEAFVWDEPRKNKNHF